jgi:hypothetical protein
MIVNVGQRSRHRARIGRASMYVLVVVESRSEHGIPSNIQWMRTMLDRIDMQCIQL